MLSLRTKNKDSYIKTGLICYKCLLVIDHKVIGKRRLCRDCRIGKTI
jgi:hypothetical protein